MELERALNASLVTSEIKEAKNAPGEYDIFLHLSVNPCDAVGARMAEWWNNCPIVEKISAPKNP